MKKKIIDNDKIDKNEIVNDLDINKNKYLIEMLKNEVEISEEKIKNTIIKQNKEILKIQTRLNSEIEKCRNFSLEKLIFELLIIIDNIERAFNLIKEKKEKIYLNILKKIEYFFQLFENIFLEFKISKINEVKVLFNPDIHQAISVVDTKEIESNKIISVMQSGYMLNNSRLLRPAMVIVSKNKNNCS